jgi:hypothetical protein
VANENQSNDVAQRLASPQQTVIDPALGARGTSRRRFARAGAGATGVLLTLTSQPGMACSVCRAPSGYHSVMVANKKGLVLSNKPNNPITCAGWPPSRWCNNLGSWKTTKFNSAFNCNSTCDAIGNSTAETLLKQCYNNSPTCQPAQASILAMWLVAAYLNVQYQKSTFLTTQHLQDIWREFQSRGTYTPIAGVTPWSYADIIVYLSGTMD